jgi:hypothetical protein
VAKKERGVGARYVSSEAGEKSRSYGSVAKKTKVGA